MSSSVYVEGFAPPDEKWHRMKAIYDNCMAEKVPVPKAVVEFFGDRTPDQRGVHVNLDEYLTPCTTRHGRGYELKVEDIPKHCTVLRFILC